MILLTGAAGFIGFHTAQALLARGESIIGVDNLNDYYDPALKHARLEILKDHANFEFYQTDISDYPAMQSIMQKHTNIDRIVHLAAQAGVRYSIENPYAYSESNLSGQTVMLEIARHCEGLKHFVYASSSSVYGGNVKQPFSEEDAVETPVSFYAATKRADEIMTQSYSHLYDIPATGLRFFTVYGPYGRPDMAYFFFTQDILSGKPLKIFNHGDMKRDFTYIDDCVAGVIGALDHPPQNGHDKFCMGGAAHRLFNLGNNKPEQLTDFVEILEKALDKKAEIQLCPMADGDVKETYADVRRAAEIFGYKPETSLTEGLVHFTDWYRKFYQ